MPARPEAFSRVLIDQALRESGWELLEDRRVRFELDSHSGRADYVLSGERGPLCVLEAKRPDLDPYEAKEQARGYAENLRAPFVILRPSSNVFNEGVEVSASDGLHEDFSVSGF